MKRRFLSLLGTYIFCATVAFSLNPEKIPYADFSNWITRKIPESKIIGGKTRVIYAIGDRQTIEGAKKFVPTPGCPWASSNVYANIMGISKASGTVVPAVVNGQTVCKMESKMEHVKALGIVNMDVMVPGTIFIGWMNEPITSTSAPYSKMEMGMPYTKRPVALMYDFMVEMPEGNTRIKSTGLSKKKILEGRDCAEIYVMLQRRWEDAEGNIYANRVGTGRERYYNSVPWTTGHELKIHYGDITSRPFYRDYMGLLDGDKAYYARNSKGKMVPVHEIGWDAEDAAPTHVLVMASSGSGTAFIGTEGLTLYIDNICFGF